MPPDQRGSRRRKSRREAQLRVRNGWTANPPVFAGQNLASLHSGTTDYPLTSNVHRRTEAAERVVLVRDRHSEDAHERSVRQVLHAGTMVLEHRLGRRQLPSLLALQSLQIGFGPACEFREQNGDYLRDSSVYARDRVDGSRASDPSWRRIARSSARSSLPGSIASSSTNVSRAAR